MSDNGNGSNGNGGKPTVEPQVVGNTADDPKPGRGQPTVYRDDWPEKTQAFSDNHLALQSVPEIAGLAIHLGVTVETVKSCMKRKHDFFEAVEYLHTVQHHMVYQMSNRNKLNPFHGQFLLKNSHGYKDKVDHDHTLNPPKKQVMRIAGQDVEF